jgi:hypothetical protein
MIIFDEDRPSDSPLVERVWRCHSEGAGPFLSIAQSRCELVVTRLGGKITVTMRGPETKATALGDCPADGEWLGIRLKPGAFVPPLPAGRLRDVVVTLPAATLTSFWLGGSVWPLPTYDDAETFIERLARADLLVQDPVVEAVFHGHRIDLSVRAVQRRFLRATGVTQGTAYQIDRARHATLLLQHGASIMSTIEQTGYSDQPHLTRELVHFIGQTPAQLLHHRRPEQMPFLYKTAPFC